MMCESQIKLELKNFRNASCVAESAKQLSLAYARLPIEVAIDLLSLLRVLFYSIGTIQCWHLFRRHDYLLADLTIAKASVAS